MLLDAGRLAVGTLTAVRVRPPSTVDRRVAGAAMLLAPLAALPLGLAVTAIGLLGHQGRLPPLVLGLLAVAAVALGTRALHLDGLSDTVDGLAASYDRERSLAVMKSGTAGPAGVVALVLVLGIQAASWGGLLGRGRWVESAVLAGLMVCCSRAALTVCCLRGVPSARADGLGHVYTQTVPPYAAVLVWTTVAVLLATAAACAALPWWRGVLAAAVSLLVVAVLVVRAVVRFGGVTGDVFGAAIELALTAGLVVLA
jgi:adenosylcobinamide-GDP ribazoletransferase